MSYCAPVSSASLVADNCEFNGPVLAVGGNYSRDPNYGPFMLNSDDASNSNDNIGARHLVLLKEWYDSSAPLGENGPSGHGLVGMPNAREVYKEDFQMKRDGRLFQVLVSDENIIQAINAVNKTHRWCKRHRPNKTVRWVERTKPERIEELRHILENGYRPSEQKQRTIYDKSSNKYRQISEPKLWPDQYVHHALVQVIQPAIMRGMDYWCCGSIPGRGSARGIRGIKRWMREDIKGTKYCAELDIHHFYQTLKPQVVMAQMERIIKDKRILELIRDTLRGGVPIGHYCSQWYANAVLEPLDHMIRERLRVRHYVRYMDNFTLFAGSKKVLHRAVKEIAKWLQNHGMALKDNWQVFPVRARMPSAMGYRFGRGYCVPRKKTVLRFKRICRRVLRRIEDGRQPVYPQACSVMSRYGWLKHSNSFGVVKRWLKPIGVGRLKAVIRHGSKKQNHKSRQSGLGLAAFIMQ